MHFLPLEKAPSPLDSRYNNRSRQKTDKCWSHRVVSTPFIQNTLFRQLLAFSLRLLFLFGHFSCTDTPKTARSYFLRPDIYLLLRGQRAAVSTAHASKPRRGFTSLFSYSLRWLMARTAACLFRAPSPPPRAS